MSLSRLRVLDELGVAPIVKTSGELVTQAELVIELGKQQRATIGGEVAAGEIGLHFA